MALNISHRERNKPEITIDAVEGVVENNLWYHFDVSNDILYLQLLPKRDQEMFGEETSEGLILLRTADDQIAGMTIISWWKRFGKGKIGNVTLHSLQTQVANMAHKIAA